MVLYSPDWTNTGFSFILLTVNPFRHSTLTEHGLYFTVHLRYLGSKKPLDGFYHYINIGSFFLMPLDKYGIRLYIRDVFFCQSVWCRG